MKLRKDRIEAILKKRSMYKKDLAKAMSRTPKTGMGVGVCGYRKNSCYKNCYHEHANTHHEREIKSPSASGEAK